MNMDLKTSELGHSFTPIELSTYFRAVWGAVSWPAKRPGFAVVIGMDYKPHFDSHDIYLLEEFESFDLRELVRHCGALDLKYGICLSRSYLTGEHGSFVGDIKNDAASRLIQEMNAEHHRDGSAEGRQPFSLTPTLMLEIENLYSFILPQIRDLLAGDRRMLFLKDGKVWAYLTEIKPEEIVKLVFGDYPGIEALAFALIEMRDYIRIREQTARLPENKPYSGHALTRGLKIRR